MAQGFSKQTIVDLDVYGRNSTSGGALVHSDDYAISNAIIFFLTSSKGDYLYRPDLGGVLEGLLFKQITVEKANYYQSFISNALKSQFGALATDIQVSITPDYDNRLFKIDIFFTSVLSGEVNQVPVNLNMPKTELGKTYTPVSLVDDNLLAFVYVQKPTLTDPLIKNQSDGLWYWGNFKFTNFSESSSNFQEVFDTINN